MSFDLYEEELLEKRDFYLNTIKHLEFKSQDDLNPHDVNQTHKLLDVTFEELRQIQYAIGNLVRQNNVKESQI